MNVILFDDESWNTLKPLSLTRPISDLRVGILTIKEKWERRLKTEISCLTKGYLQDKFPLKVEKENLLINSTTCPDEDIIKAILSLEENQVLMNGQTPIAYYSSNTGGSGLFEYEGKKIVNYDNPFNKIVFPYHIFALNGKEITKDFHLITEGRKSQKIGDYTRHFGKYPLFVEEGAIIRDAVINTEEGPVYVGKDCEIMEGALIRGPLAMCEQSVIKMGAKIYGATTLGPCCKCGGEINNVVFQAYSNKAHDGFLGNSAIGEWCNFGAGTNNSNLKNTYVEVKLWDYKTKRFLKTGMQFCGLVMGDHSKTGISVTINTGTVIGVGVNLFGPDFPRNFIPSFSWGGASGFTEHQLPKFYETATAVMARREKKLDDCDIKIIEHIFQDSER